MTGNVRLKWQRSGAIFAEYHAAFFRHCNPKGTGTFARDCGNVEESSAVPSKLSDAEKEHWLTTVRSYINGAGNLLLITPGENSSAGNRHLADKRYEGCLGGSYAEHDLNRDKRRRPEEWSRRIQERGEKVFDFMLRTLVDGSERSHS